MIKNYVINFNCSGLRWSHQQRFYSSLSSIIWKMGRFLMIFVRKSQIFFSHFSIFVLQVSHDDIIAVNTLLDCNSDTPIIVISTLKSWQIHEYIKYNMQNLNSRKQIHKFRKTSKLNFLTTVIPRFNRPRFTVSLDITCLFGFPRYRVL